MFKGLKTKIIILMNILLITLFLVGCSGGSYKIKSSIENNTNNSMVMSYSNFEGYKFTTLKLKNGDKLNLNIKVTTEEGNLKIALIDENDDELFKVGNPKDEIVKTIEINKDGTYKLKVEGNHKGSYKIDWDIETS
ncbi:hypothetical protein [uncultured Clostridium sp.]|uniref:hypothetical protein n=1 Tax=uncultured Clostridium sp. TaxID=59620 RepID=UPI0028EA3DEA|nr:hypothetical protein [uncultured Clostridium sp.]